MKLQLTKSSIDKALELINNAENQLRYDMPLAFYKKCCLYLIEMMNQRVDASQIGDNVKNIIKAGWQYEPIVTGYANGFVQAKLVNNSDKSTYVEFGVGLTALEEGTHPNYQRAGYQYNVSSGKKDDDGYWIFNVASDMDIDIPNKYIENRTERSVKTKGAPATLFAYQSLMDFANSNMPQLLWEETKKEFWGKL